MLGFCYYSAEELAKRVFDELNSDSKAEGSVSFTERQRNSSEAYCDLAKSYEELSVYCKSLESELGSCVNAVRRMESNYSCEAAKIKEETERLREENAKLHEIVKQSCKGKSSLQEKLVRLQREYNALERERDSLSVNLKNYFAKSKEMAHDLLCLKKENEKLKAQVQSITADANTNRTESRKEGIQPESAAEDGVLDLLEALFSVCEGGNGSVEPSIEDVFDLFS